MQIKESVGLSKASSDADLDAATVKLGELEREVKLLKAVLETANKAATSALAAARNQSLDVLKALSEKTVRGTDVEFLAKYAHVHAYLDGTLPEKLQEAFAKAVVAPLDEWLAELTAARADVKEAAQKRCVRRSRSGRAGVSAGAGVPRPAFVMLCQLPGNPLYTPHAIPPHHRCSVIFDHYKTKVQQLKEAKRKAQMAGKVTDRKEEEKLQRNEAKFAGASDEWLGWRDRTLGRLLHCFEGASTHLHHILLRVMQYEGQVRARERWWRRVGEVRRRV